MRSILFLLKKKKFFLLVLIVNCKLLATADYSSTQIEFLLNAAESEKKDFHYQKAITCYEKILKLNPHNKKAVKELNLLHTLVANYNKESYHETKTRMLLDVTKAWEETNTEQPSFSIKELHQEIKDSSNDTMISKLNSLIISNINIENLSISEAIDYLKQKSLEQDPLKKGINIFLKLPDITTNSISSTNIISLKSEPSVSLQLNEVPLYVALKYIATQANLTLRIDSYAVALLPPSTENDVLIVKEYKVPPHFLPSQKENISQKTEHNSQKNIPFHQVRDYFQSQGIDFPADASANYFPSSNKLIIRSTQENLDLIDILVAAAKKASPSQVSIETKFIEVTQDQLDQLGFNWLLGPLQIGNSGLYTQGKITTPSLDPNSNLTSGESLNAANSLLANTPLDTAIHHEIQETSSQAATPGIFNISGIYNTPQLELIIKALNQKKGVDVMAAPHVTTKSGLKATVKIIDEFIYPTHYTPPQIPQSTTNAGSLLNQTPPTIAPAFPNSWATKEVGVILEAKPTVEPDGCTINLELHPQTIDFDGFINYGTAINTIGYRALSLTNTSLTPFSSTLTTNTMNQPVFTVREITTSVMVGDGQTIVLGGLIREETEKIADKVPVLGDIPLAGRLFQSKKDKRVKKNLIIFVTPKILHTELTSSSL